LVEEGKAAARDEEAMKAKWISQCLKLHRGQLEKIEEKNVLLKAKKDLHDRKYDDGSNGNDGDYSEDGSGEDGEDGDGGSGDDSGSPVNGTLRNSEKDKDKEKEKEGEKKFSGGFSLEQCVAAVRLKAREREEAAQHRIPPAIEGTREGEKFTSHLHIITSHHITSHHITSHHTTPHHTTSHHTQLLSLLFLFLEPQIKVNVVLPKSTMTSDNKVNQSTFVKCVPSKAQKLAYSFYRGFFLSSQCPLLYFIMTQVILTS
jgi:hypothetical protein